MGISRSLIYDKIQRELSFCSSSPALYLKGERREYVTTIGGASVIPKLSEASIRHQTIAQSFERGEVYYRNGAVTSLIQRGMVLSGKVEGSEPDLIDRGVELSERLAPLNRQQLQTIVQNLANDRPEWLDEIEQQIEQVTQQSSIKSREFRNF
jgi:hypothetical protein